MVIFENIDIDIDIDKAIPKISISISISIWWFWKISISISISIRSIREISISISISIRRSWKYRYLKRILTIPLSTFMDIVVNMCDKTLSKCLFWVVQRTIRICETYVITDLKSAKYQLFFEILQWLWTVLCDCAYSSGREPTPQLHVKRTVRPVDPTIWCHGHRRAINRYLCNTDHWMSSL